MKSATIKIVKLLIVIGNMYVRNVLCWCNGFLTNFALLCNYLVQEKWKTCFAYVMSEFWFHGFQFSDEKDFWCIVHKCCHRKISESLCYAFWPPPHATNQFSLNNQKMRYWTMRVQNHYHSYFRVSPFTGDLRQFEFKKSLKVLHERSSLKSFLKNHAKT